ncbi:TIGR01777 family oxidoreductase [Mechercharimyces sp. CAU 1602]|uniref:TIGR01777 family oxidoreductase n=1 Tax=Mechercharimyces sp. CAU 1602 TaxID=2973933 RepID=UPI002161FD2E|nr:TIGR01777 family oxidoreductase [Mechercharimyces sp. CAU 1602]MCS1351814.1 TIGR01777 family oxidoreductase [Mechercharimyces sp. CAU 1602]
MRIAITGSTGMVGNRLVNHFRQEGHHVTRLVRGESGSEYDEPAIYWNPTKGEISKEGLEGQDVVIHLAGANIAARKWTRERKYEILKSRQLGTSLLAQALTELSRPPALLLSASGGEYADTSGRTPVDESCPLGKGFLASVEKEWEKETEVAAQAGIRVVNMRLGVVMSRKGGALAKMLPLFRVGLGGRMGSGKQITSWILLDEIPYIIHHLIQHEEVIGPVNMVSPNPVTNAEFSRILAKVLGRPALFPKPAGLIKLLLGEMGEEVLLTGSRIEPGKLKSSGYQFRYPELESALKHELQG